MGIGISVFLLAVGAILTFAVEKTVSGLDLDVVGWVLMGAGALGLIITLMVWGRARRRVVEQGAAPTVVERDIYEDRPPL